MVKSYARDVKTKLYMDIGVDISLSDTKTYYVKHPTTDVVKTYTPSFVSDGVDGKVVFTFDADEIESEVAYLVHLIVTWSDGRDFASNLRTFTRHALWT